MSEHEKKMQEAIDRAAKFLDDIYPQLGGLCIQDFANLNQLGILINELKTPD